MTTSPDYKDNGLSEVPNVGPKTITGTKTNKQTLSKAMNSFGAQTIHIYRPLNSLGHRKIHMLWLDSATKRIKKKKRHLVVTNILFSFLIRLN